MPAKPNPKVQPKATSEPEPKGRRSRDPQKPPLPSVVRKPVPRAEQSGNELQERVDSVHEVADDFTILPGSQSASADIESIGDKSQTEVSQDRADDGDIAADADALAKAYSDELKTSDGTASHAN